MTKTLHPSQVLTERLKEAVLFQFSLAKSGPEPEAVALETREGIIFGGHALNYAGDNAANSALAVLEAHNSAVTTEDLTHKFEVSSIAIVVLDKKEPDRRTLDALGGYIGTSDGQIVHVLGVTKEGVIQTTRQLKL